MHMLRNYGLKPFAPAPTGGWMGDVAVLNAETMPAADRYRTYLAVALGQVKVVIGTRAVMYAPVEGPALFAILEDAAYQNMDGMMPYPQARGVMRLRAKSHGGVFVAMANARTPQSQWENTGPGTVETPVSGYSTAIHPLASPLKDATLGCVGSIAMSLRVSLTRPSGRACRIRPSACYLRLWKVAPCCYPFRKTMSVRP